MKLNFRLDHYPFWSRGRLDGVAHVDILARITATPVPGGVDIADKNDAAAKRDTLTKDMNMGSLFVGKFTNITLSAVSEGDLTLFVDYNALGDLWIGLTWGEA